LAAISCFLRRESFLPLVRIQRNDCSFENETGMNALKKAALMCADDGGEYREERCLCR